MFMNLVSWPTLVFLCFMVGLAGFVDASAGGGGLISGIALAIKSLKPSCKVIGVQAATVPSMYESCKSGKIVCCTPDIRFRSYLLI